MNKLPSNNLNPLYHIICPFTMTYFLILYFMLSTVDFLLMCFVLCLIMGTLSTHGTLLPDLIPFTWLCILPVFVFILFSYPFLLVVLFIVYRWQWILSCWMTYSDCLIPSIVLDFINVVLTAFLYSNLCVFLSLFF